MPWRSAGLLDYEVGGPGVKPYQPARALDEVSLTVAIPVTSRTTARSCTATAMYTYWKRSVTDAEAC